MIWTIPGRLRRGRCVWTQPMLTRWLGALTGASPLDETPSSGSERRTAPAQQQQHAEAREATFEQFFHAHEDTILGYLWRITGDEQASHDIAQETFLRAWQRFEQVSRYEQPRAWLFRVATNLASNHRRHRSIHDATVTHISPTLPATLDPAAGIAESAVVRAAAPNWQPGNFPTSGITFGERSDDILTFGVASTDGNIAYACYSRTSNTGGHVNSQITIYRTSDRAAHWTRLTQFPWPDAQTSECEVQVDALDSSRVLVNIMGQDVTTLNGAQWYELTEDSGITWTRLPYGDGLSYLATANGRTYAVRWQVVGQQSNGHPKYDVHLSVSTDHLRTWQPIDVPITSAGGGVNQFWVRPDGTILATVSSRVGMLQQSTDGGAHWKAIPLPTLSAGLGFGSIGVQQPTTTSQPWHICIDEVTTDGPVGKRSDTGVICTFDGGVTWSIRPTLCTNAPCSTRAVQYLERFAIASDGALLAGAPDSSFHIGLYRLPEDSSQWEYLGPISGGFFAPASSAGGVVWSFAGGVYTDNLSGIIGGHLGSLPNVLLSTAAYP